MKYIQFFVVACVGSAFLAAAAPAPTKDHPALSISTPTKSTLPLVPPPAPMKPRARDRPRPSLDNDGDDDNDPFLFSPGTPTPTGNFKPLPDFMEKYGHKIPSQSRAENSAPSGPISNTDPIKPDTSRAAQHSASGQNSTPFPSTSGKDAW